MINSFISFSLMMHALCAHQACKEVNIEINRNRSRTKPLIYCPKGVVFCPKDFWF